MRVHINRLEFMLMAACALVGIGVKVRVRGGASLRRTSTQSQRFFGLLTEHGLLELRRSKPSLEEVLKLSEIPMEVELSREEVELAAAQAGQFAQDFDGSGWSDFANMSWFALYPLKDGPERLTRLSESLTRLLRE